MQGRDQGAVIALGLTSLLLQVPFLDRAISFYDEGSILAIADGLRHGAVMYRDHVTPTAPLTYEVTRVLFDLFGPSLVVARIAQAVVFSLCVVLVYAVLRQFMPLRGALLGALACLPVKTLGFPLWTIVNYSQLAMLFCLAGVLATLLFQRQRGWWWLVAAGSAAGLTVVTKQNLGGLLGITLGAAVAIDAACEPGGLGRRLGQVVRYETVLLAASLAPVVATMSYYAWAGALDDLIDRAVIGLSYLTGPYGLPFPILFGSMAPSAVMFSYFPSAVAQMAWQGRFDVYASPDLYLALANGVRVLYLAPLVAAGLAAVALARGAMSGVARMPWHGLLLLLLFAATTYASMLYRPDWTHLMNVFVPQLLLGWVVLWWWTDERRAAWLLPAVCSVWLAAGAVGAYAVFAGYNTPVDTPRGRLFGRPDEAENTRGVLAYLAAQPVDARILALRADPLYYYLSDRRMPGRFDLLMPGIVGPGDDDVIARGLREVEQVIYNPKFMLTVQAPLTEYAPETARTLANEFRVAGVLNPTAVVLERGAAPPPAVTVVDLWQRFGDLRQFVNGGPPNPNSMPPRYEPVSWMMYRVLGTAIHERDQQACFDVAHGVGPDEAIAVTPMLHPITWAQVPGDPDYSRDLVGARFTIAVQTPDSGWQTVHSGEQPPGPPGERLRISLARFAGRSVDIRFCAESLTPRPGKAYALPGWAEPRIVRERG